MPQTIPILDAAEYATLISMSQPQPITPASQDRYARDRLLIFLMLEAGLRSSECSLIKHADCYYDTEPSRVINITAAAAKRQQPRDIPCTPILHQALCHYRPGHHTTHILTPSPPLLSSLTYPKGTSVRTNQRIVERWSKSLIAREIWPHVLRHTFAMRLLRSGCSLPVLQHLLGHRHLSSTQVYMHTNSKDTSDAIAAMARKDPHPPLAPALNPLPPVP